MSAFLWAGRGSWDVGREDYKKKKRGSPKSSKRKILCSLCNKFIPKSRFYSHREKVHGIKDITLAELKEYTAEKED